VLFVLCEIWTVTMREEHKLRVFQNRVLRRIRLKRDKVIGECRNLHNVRGLMNCTAYQILFG